MIAWGYLGFTSEAASSEGPVILTVYVIAVVSFNESNR